MDNQMAMGIARRFIRLPLEKRRPFLEKMLHEGVSPANLPIPPLRADFDKLPLSFAQERQWFLWQMDPTSSAYHVPIALRLHGVLDLEALQRAFDSLVQRHETLRTTFVLGEERPEQVIHEPVPLTIERHNASFDEVELKNWIEYRIAQPFDLQHGPLLRVSLLQMAADQHVLLVVQHHIVCDGQSMQVMVDELVRLYGAFSQGGKASLAPLPIQYADYAIWQRRWMEAGERERQMSYWQTQLGSDHTVLELPFDRPRPAVRSDLGALLSIDLPATLGQNLKALAQRQGVTLFMLLLTSFQVLLHRYSGQGDIRVGVPVANRNRVETQGLIGFFINTQVLRAEIHPGQTFSELLQQVRQRTLGAQDHQELPFEQLVEGLQPERSLSHTPLFQVMFNHQHAARQATDSGSSGPLQVSPLAWSSHTAQFDLTLATYESATGLAATLTYATDLFEPGRIERMARHWLNLLHGIVANPQAKVALLPLLETEEQALIVEQWNDTTVTDYPLDTPIHRLIEEQVLATPDAPALHFGEQALSYRELDQRANQLAHQLIALGVGPEVLVGIAVERSLEMVVGLLAILKAGGAYVPLDPEYPEERLAYMIEDSRIGLLLSQSHLNLPCPQRLAKLNLDTLSLEGFSVQPPAVAVDPEHLAYVIYTSGSTGKPKGAGNRHKALTNRLCWMQHAYNLGLGDTVLQKTPFSFDVSVWEFFWPLMTGAHLAIAGPGDHRDPRRLIALINKHQVSTLHFVPSMLQMFLLDEQVSSCTSLRRIVCSGEALPVDAQNQVLAKLPNAALYNLYGPTEAAIDVTHWHCRDEGLDAVPIGKPIANLQTYVLDVELQPVPAGVVGELYLGGEGLARGYHRRPALTAERFVTSPLGYGQRLYRTGDLASLRTDGVIEYRGRIDHQVKIRGLRIELGEIEARLMEQEAVREAVVLAIDGTLIAYVVPTDWTAQDQEAQRDIIREPLRQTLPDYMVPSQLLFIERLPLSPNGKLERKALPKPDFTQVQKTYVAPRSALEQRIAAIWQDVLKLERVGLNDNFFELGGDSIISIQVVSRARQAGIDFTPKDLFQHQTVQHLASVAQQDASQLAASFNALPHDWQEAAEVATRSVTPADFPLTKLTQAQLDNLPIPVDQVQTLYPLSPMQQGMLFHTLQSSAASLYVTQTSVPVEGLDNQRFIDAWNAVIARHEMLRTGFWHDNLLSEPLQIVRRQASLPLRLLDWRGHEVSEQQLHAEAQADCQRGFDLLQAPLIHLTLIRLSDTSQQLIWTAHHILMDGWSSSQLLAEVFALYAGHPLPAKQGHYQDYIQWLQAQDTKALESFWCARLQDIGSTTQLAAAVYPKPAAGQTGHQQLCLDWDISRTQALRLQAQRLRITPNTLIQGAWLLLLQAYTGQQTVCFGATVAGRPTSLPGAGDILGLFINTLPIIQSPRPELQLRQWLAQLQADNLEVRDHEHASLADLQRWAGHPGQALFDSIIVFENYPVSERLDDAQRSQLRFGKAQGRDVTNYPMDLEVHLGESLRIKFLYLRSHFTEQSVHAIRGEFERLLQAMLTNPDSALGNLLLWQPQAQPTPTAPTTPSTLLVERIAQHAHANPDQVAVSCAGQYLTYAQLEVRANRLAHYLMAQGIGPEHFVGIALERSLEVITSFLAVMKAGAAYVPLDIDYPPERIRWAMQDSGMTLLLTRGTVYERLPQGTGVPCTDLDGLDLSAFPAHTPVQRSGGDNLAYLIYTSGSTGNPKGVSVTHAPLAMHCQAIAELYEMDASTCELLFMSFAFDGAQERWLSTLSSGGRLVLRDNRLWTPEETWQALHQEQVSIACFPPAYLQQLAEYGETQTSPPPVRIYCFGGDAVADANFELVKRSLRPQYLTNGYGPTETVVTPLLWKADLGQRCEAVYAPIGKVVGNRTLQVLDPLLRPLPSRLAGELYIGGEGVARGYHARPSLTAERFVPDPFGTPGARLYRTGDLVRARLDGVYDYLGRLDNQVKIRGFRIELGEIESRLRSYPGVQDAVVVARDISNGKQLVGYVVGNDLQTDALRAQLGAELPDYMVPAHLQLLAHLPLSPNGKVDRKALPDPDFKANVHVPPRNALEHDLVKIWQEVLEREQVGITDNFFELGGDSLRILRVLSKARALAHPGFELKLRDLMGKPTIAELSGFDPRETASAPNPLLALNRPTPGSPPLFCLHAGFGTLFDYEPLARCLEGQRSVVGVQCRMLLDREWQDSSLTQMADDYVAAIRSLQPHGPYALLGWSLGGALAVLVADNLKRQGQEVEYLGLVDSFSPHGQVSADDGHAQELAQFLGVILGRPVESLAPLTLQGEHARAALEQLIRDEQGKGPENARYSGFDAADLALVFIVAMKLKALSERLESLPVVSGPASVWWANTTPATERKTFEQVLGGQLQRRTLPAGHHELLDHPGFLEHLLRDLTSPAPLQS
ncbi:non-ribosomal peptide synthetase [Pseudomonas sp. DG56-2]|uniref:amino acid adenylation domain-containing protein n=1 Tax=Pseudomonas sp. DG56-2 TaxID=2320270 RepID=UPI002113C8AC|nr:non-ribosomal peptide synthetase [Pseudomonas sp. DG56-2]